MTDNGAAKVPERRHFVIGSSGYRGVDSVEWDAENLPNIVDYDTVIVDVRSLDEAKLKLVSHDFLVQIMIQLIRLIDSDGKIIVLTDLPHTDHRPNSYPARIENYDWCPIHIGIADERGKTIICKDSRFETYLEKLKDWSYYLFIPKSCLTRELMNYYGSTNNTRYRIPLLPFLTNRYDKVLAGSFRIEVKREYTKVVDWSSYKTYPKEPDVVTGEIVLLPLLPDYDPKQAVALVLEELVGAPVRAETPDWAEAIVVPGIDNIDARIGKRRKNIKKTFAEIEALDTKRRELQDFRRLLFASGSDLEDIVAKSLNRIGGKVTPAKYGEEEFILEYNGREYLIEVKGVGKSITLGHLRQLNDYLLKYEEETGQECKGILFGNAWRNNPLDQRGTKDKPEFPDNVIKRATKWQISLVSSTQFFFAFCSCITDASRAKSVLERLTGSNGIVDFKQGDHSNKEN